jgi:hypothetical protein
VLVCVGGLIALGGLVVLGTQVVRDEAEASVTKYLTALRDEKYTQAYALLCDRRQAALSEADFVNAQLDAPRVASFTVGRAEISDQIRVPAAVDYANGRTRSIDYLLEQDTDTGGVEVCGEAG